jgi:hypothetical protein
MWQKALIETCVVIPAVMLRKHAVDGDTRLKLPRWKTLEGQQTLRLARYGPTREQRRSRLC